MIFKQLFRFSTQQARISIKYNNLAIVELNNPTKRNALSKQMLIELNQIIDEIQSSSHINCVVLKSQEAGMFCSGADLKERKGLSEEDTETLVMGLRNTFQRWFKLAMPTLALIDGPALGGGLELALACDIRIATVNSIIALPETSLAIIPGAGGTQRLPRLIGAARAKELIFTGSRITPQKALEIGLINYLENDYSMAILRSEEIAMKILQNGPIGVRAAKQAINMGMDIDLESGLHIESLMYHKVCVSKDRIEGLQAFNEKRKPVYKGE